jgi:hypothetical protein
MTYSSALALCGATQTNSAGKLLNFSMIALTHSGYLVILSLKLAIVPPYQLL